MTVATEPQLAVGRVASHGGDGMAAALGHRVNARAAHGRLPDAELARLVRAAAAGNELAWERLVHEFAGLLWAVTRSHRLTDADAADVAQATWVRLVEHLHRLNKPGRVGAWLATTARRECLRVLREGQRQVLFGADPPEDRAIESAPDTELMIAERDGALWRAFSRLQPSDQALLRLLMADPCPAYEEISAALGMPIGSIGPTRARALERLRRELDSWETLSI
jgi:RNA polymerase sigma factor (sigma-70 family)